MTGLDSFSYTCTDEFKGDAFKKREGILTVHQLC